MDVTTVTQQKLRPNPFEAYRDPLTGKWVVINCLKVTSDHNFNPPKPLSNDSKSREIGSFQELPPHPKDQPRGESEELI
jgi:hypothetical protein